MAKNEIQKTLSSDTLPEGYQLRVGIKGGACSASFLIGLDKATPYDDLHPIDGIEVLIDRRHLMYVVGAKIDFSTEPTNPGFLIAKP